ncbi:hypothetical protein XENOCAPTIV_007818, partial [Xenoophorus captivus]
SKIGPEEAFFLYSSGPDLTSIMPCKYGKSRGSISKFVSQEGLSSKEVQSISLDANAFRSLLPIETHGLQSVLHKIGGTGNFVFLFAQTVELSDCEKTQALALRVLLSLCKHNQHRIHEMDCYHGYSMIHQVLIKSKCIVGYHMLKVSHTLNSRLFRSLYPPSLVTLLDGCCSGSVLILGDDGQFRLDAESVAVVQDVKLLSEILLDWKIWAKAEVNKARFLLHCGVWETLLTALEILIRVHHPHQVYNIRQFLNAEVVHRFLLTCQVLQEHRDDHLTAISQEVCLSFIKIIQEVLGSPPDMDLLKLICNFLLAVHPPTNTYVCHTPSSFYFSLHIGKEAVLLNTVPLNQSPINPMHQALFDVSVPQMGSCTRKRCSPLCT